MSRDIAFSLYEYFNESGKVVDALVVADGDIDPDQLEPADLQERLAAAVSQGRYGPALADGIDQRQTTEVAQGAAALVAIVDALFDGAINVPKARTITSVSVNRRAPIGVTDIVPAVEGLMGKQAARAVQAVFGRPPGP